MATITFENVSKTFARAGGRKVLGAHIREWISGHGKKEEPFYALRDVSFEVEPGTSLGLIGPNGAGKSTTLALATGICQPTKGKITVTGRPVALLELGSGFHPELSGFENMQLNAALMGMTRQELRTAEPLITAFADIGDFMHEPLRTYSSGMTLRLAFAIAVHSNPSVLIVDEVIGVGDAAFQLKCSERLRQLREKKVTILCTSHSAEVMRVMCDHLIWIEKGQIRMRGTPDEVLRAYAGG
jgi:ABC-type polysaccharide/polyol phosphate transport system ATPase subunit